eukprot:9325263-Pyramimonas_sp.AAC.2
MPRIAGGRREEYTNIVEQRGQERASLGASSLGSSCGSVSLRALLRGIGVLVELLWGSRGARLRGSVVARSMRVPVVPRSVVHAFGCALGFAIACSRAFAVARWCARELACLRRLC